MRHFDPDSKLYLAGASKSGQLIRSLEVYLIRLVEDARKGYIVL